MFRVLLRDVGHAVAAGVAAGAAVSITINHCLIKPKPPGPPIMGTPAHYYYELGRADKKDGVFSVRCPPELEDEVYAHGVWDGHGVVSRGPGRITFRVFD
jgi:hypothetical protein